MVLRFFKISCKPILQGVVMKWWIWVGNHIIIIHSFPNNYWNQLCDLLFHTIIGYKVDVVANSHSTQVQRFHNGSLHFFLHGSFPLQLSNILALGKFQAFLGHMISSLNVAIFARATTYKQTHSHSQTSYSLCCKLTRAFPWPSNHNRSSMATYKP